MVEIINVKTGESLGLEDKPLFIKISETSGSFVATDRESAIGVALNSKPYNLFGQDKIPGAETVMLREIPVSEALERRAKASELEDVDGLLVDQEYRLTLLELGVTE